MASVQELIHKLEEGVGARYIKIGALAMLTLSLVVAYNWRCFRNLNTLEAMDTAQVGRNLADGKGFSTMFVRPFSIYLLQRHADPKSAIGTNGVPADTARLKGMHPDLANPPVYPLLLAGLWKIAPSWWAIREIDDGSVLWNQDGRFWWYPPDFFIALLNQALLLLTVLLVYRLASAIFDKRVALLATLVVLGTELLWQFSVSGLSTVLLILLFTGLVTCLWKIESGARENLRGDGHLGWLSALAGVLVGLLAMTRYSMIWLMVPVLFFLTLYSGQRRLFNAALATGVFLLAIAPWLFRNHALCGESFGVATYSYAESTMGFARDDLQRSLTPNLGKFHMGMFWRKLISNCRTVASEDIPQMGGTWIIAFFLVSLLLSFRNPGITRLKFFLLGCLGLLALVQAIGKTQLSKDSPVINSENLLVVLVPALAIFGVSLYRVLRDQLKVPSPEIRVVIDIVFVFAMCLPMAFTLWPPRISAIQYPPYYPPIIQRVSGWMKADELVMSDIPWAVAWYGNRQSIWITTNPEDAYFAIEDTMKPIKALYLTPRTTDAKFISEWIETNDRSWAGFILDVAVRRQVPRAFPLQNSPDGFPFPQQLFLTDRIRWQRPAR